MIKKILERFRFQSEQTELPIPVAEVEKKIKATLKELGIKPNTQYIVKKNLLCKDGHKADSISELKFWKDSIEYKNEDDVREVKEGLW